MQPLRVHVPEAVSRTADSSLHPSPGSSAMVSTDSALLSCRLPFRRTMVSMVHILLCCCQFTCQRFHNLMD